MFVTGGDSGLASVNTIVIPSSVLDISGATEDRIVMVDIREYLPLGIELAESEEPNLEIRLCVEELGTRTMELTERDITMTGRADDRNYRLIPSRIEVTLRGLSEELGYLSERDLEASLELDGLGVGVHTVALNFAESDRFAVTAQSEFQVEITPLSGVVEAGTQPQETGESGQGESMPEPPSSSAQGPGLPGPAVEAGADSGAVIPETSE